jgi:hypothetical protein
VEEFLKENAYSFPVYYDRESLLKEKYSPRVPTTYIIGNDGFPLARISGNKNWDSKESLEVLGKYLPLTIPEY